MAKVSLSTSTVYVNISVFITCIVHYENLQMPNTHEISTLCES